MEFSNETDTNEKASKLVSTLGLNGGGEGPLDFPSEVCATYQLLSSFLKAPFVLLLVTYIWGNYLHKRIHTYVYR
jgi:hypothetical protein